MWLNGTPNVWIGYLIPECSGTVSPVPSSEKLCISEEGQCKDKGEPQLCSSV